MGMTEIMRQVRGTDHRFPRQALSADLVFLIYKRGRVPFAARPRLELSPDRTRDWPALDAHPTDCQRDKHQIKQNRRPELDRRVAIIG